MVLLILLIKQLCFRAVALAVEGVVAEVVDVIIILLVVEDAETNREINAAILHSIAGLMVPVPIQVGHVRTLSQAIIGMQLSRINVGVPPIIAHVFQAIDSSGAIL